MWGPVGCALFLLFTAVPLVELYLLVWLGGLWGFWPTVALVRYREDQASPAGVAAPRHTTF